MTTAPQPYGTPVALRVETAVATDPTFRNVAGPSSLISGAKGYAWKVTGAE